VAFEAEKRTLVDGEEGSVGDGSAEKSLELSPLKEGSDKDRLQQETREDESLKPWKSLADRGEGGYYWRDGFLVKLELDALSQPVLLIVLPKSFRIQVLKTAHESSGHFSKTKTHFLIRRMFVWPLMARDVSQHCSACLECQKMSKSGPRRAPMVRRKAVVVPFEKVAIDLVGPFDKAKGGYRYLLTNIDLATKWPEAIPLKSITARVVIARWPC